MSKVIRIALQVVGFVLAGATSFANGQGVFMGLGDLPGGPIESWATAVSADGNVVVGFSASKDNLLYEAFRWTREGGMQGLGYLDGGLKDSGATGVSGDGSTVVGYSGVVDAAAEGFQWTSMGGLTTLGHPHPNLYSYIIANDVSDDGTTVVGFESHYYHAQRTVNEALRWHQVTGWTQIVPDGTFVDYYDSEARGVSGNGAVVVGVAAHANNQLEAFRWTEAAGMSGLGYLFNDPFYHLGISQANDVSADGAFVVGWSDAGSNSYEPFRWTKATGMQSLGRLLGSATFGEATSVTDDGRIVVGLAFVPERGDQDIAFIWDEDHGIRSLHEVLVNEYGLGASLAGWTLNDAFGISGDGRVIVGVGTNPDHRTEAWVVYLVPEPGSCYLMSFGAIAIAYRRMRIS